MTTSEPNQEKRRKRTFDPAFKEEAIELGRRIGIVQASKDLGISQSCLRKWTKTVDTTGKQSLLPMNQRSDLEAENRRLREELRIVKMEREILKKAATFFAKDAE